MVNHNYNTPYFLNKPNYIICIYSIKNINNYVIIMIISKKKKNNINNTPKTIKILYIWVFYFTLYITSIFYIISISILIYSPINKIIYLIT